MAEVFNKFSVFVKNGKVSLRGVAVDEDSVTKVVSNSIYFSGVREESNVVVGDAHPNVWNNRRGVGSEVTRFFLVTMTEEEYQQYKLDGKL